jgi:GTPase
MENENKNNYKAGFIGIVGFPNVGKSTLVNALVGEKVSIVSAKPQTTRQRVFGILSRPEGQIIFTDLPGLTGRPGEVNSFLRGEFFRGLSDADALLIVDDITENASEKIADLLVKEKIEKPILVVINKVDLAPVEKLADRVAFWEQKGFKSIGFSALKPLRLPKEFLINDLINMLPVAPAPLYDAELYTTQNLRDMVSEVIREKCFERLHKEIPYGLAVKILKFEEPNDKGIGKIYAEIILAKENHKPIVVGKGGQALKAIGQIARAEIEKMLGYKVYLDLHVQVRRDWVSSESFLQELGYVNEH